MPKSSSRSPLRERPLRIPGQSLDEQIDGLICEQLIQAMMVPLLTVLLAGLEWWRAYHPVPPAPWPLTLLALGAVVWCGWKVPPMWRQLHALKLGRDGERVVGQELEDLRRQGCHVLHDIPGHRGNIDHAVVALSGVYAVETKTYRKPVDRNEKARFDGRSLIINGMDRGAELLGQVSAERDELKRLVKELTGKDVPVRAVILLPGWYVDTAGPWRKSGIWVLHPGMLPAFLRNEPAVLRPDEVELIKSSLATYVRQHPAA